MAISDTLWQAENEILDYQREGIIASEDDPELNLLTDLMRAVRCMPGRDRPPSAGDTFDADLEVALAAYHDACARRRASAAVQAVSPPEDGDAGFLKPKRARRRPTPTLSNRLIGRGCLNVPTGNR